MLKDVNTDDTPEYNPDKLAVAGNLVFFAAGNPASGYELWKSDGTEAGTELVRDINPGTGGSQLNFLTAVGNVLYFSAVDGTHGRELL